MVIFLLGALLIPLVFWFEFSVAPPYWVHAVIWPPTALILTIGMLRPAKALFVALHFKNLQHKYDDGN